MKILVTGGAGFIGSALIRHIINNTQHEVLNIDLLTYAGSELSLDSIKGNPRYSFRKVDIADPVNVRNCLSNFKPDFVMNLAAETHVDRSIESPSGFIHSNIFGVFNMLECAKEYWEKLPTAKKETFRFHQISTDEVFGDLPHPDTHTGDLKSFSEDDRYEPSSPYSASKAAGDHLVRAWSRTYGLPTIITNCSNNYGPYHYPEKLIPLTISRALRGQNIPIYGNGSQIRDWLFVEDHARALELVVTKGKPGETYNIGGQNEYRNIQVVDMICDRLQAVLPDRIKIFQKTHFRELKTFVQDRPGHDMRYSIDASKIKSELGWEPIESFQSGLEKTIQWNLENFDWISAVTESGKKK